MRRVQTEVELESGQSFVIAGLLDNRTTENLSKIPGIGDIPLLGKLFQSRSLTKTNSELLVLVTPELVHPIPAGGKTPEIKMPRSFIKGLDTQAPQNPVDEKGKLPAVKTLPLEILKNWSEPEPTDNAPNAPAGNSDQGVKPLLQLNPAPPGVTPSPVTNK